MKTRLAVCMTLTLLVLTVSLFAGVPTKAELSFGGTYSNPKDGSVSYAAVGELLFPVGKDAIVLLGPNATFSDVDENTGLGATVEFNIPGGQHGGFFAGAVGTYFLDSLEDQEDYTVNARAGLKLPIAQSGLVKLFVERGIDGRDRDDEDLGGGVLAVIKF